MEKYPIIIDWLTFSWHCQSFEEMIDFLGLSNSGLSFEPRPPMWFHQSAMTYNNEITLLYGQQKDHSLCTFNISGRGCRSIESFSEFCLFDLIIKAVNLGCQFSRIDLAMDVIDDNFKIKYLVDDYFFDNYICRSNFTNVMISNNKGVKGTSLYFGKQESNLFINIYDKRAERGYSPSDMPCWTRIELRFRHENAAALSEQLIDCSIGDVFQSWLNTYLRFVKRCETDTNKNRWETAEYWQLITDTSVLIDKPIKKGIDYDLSKFEEYVYNTLSGSIRTFLKTHPNLSLKELYDIMELNGGKINPRQQILIDNFIDGVDYMESINVKQEYQS